MRKLLTAAVVVALVVLGFGVPANAATQYTSCAALHKDFPRGIANSELSAYGATLLGFQRPSVRASIYDAVSGRLDENDDGLVCEVVNKGVPPLTAPQKAFVGSMKEEYPQLKALTDRQLFAVGKVICLSLDQGAAMSDVLDRLIDLHLPTGVAGSFLGTSIGYLCPGHSQFLKDYVASLR